MLLVNGHLDVTVRPATLIIETASENLRDQHVFAWLCEGRISRRETLTWPDHKFVIAEPNNPQNVRGTRIL